MLLTMNLAPDRMFAFLLLGEWEIVLILAIFVVLIGAKRLPEIARRLGDGVSRFRDATRKLTDDLGKGAHDAGESLGGICGKRAAQALTPDNQTAELYNPAVFKQEQKDGGRNHPIWFRYWPAFILIGIVCLFLLSLCLSRLK